MTQYYVVKYDNEASGPFVAEGANLTWSGGVGFIVTVVDFGTVGKLMIALVSGVAPTDDQVLTQGSTTADADTDSLLMLYPAYFREDLTVPSTGIMVWSGPALSSTHSFFFDGQTGNVTAGDTLTFSGGAECEIITVESDAGVSGELSVRFISNIDDGLPADDETFSNGSSGDGVVNGVIHDRAYSPLHLHRLLSDLNDDEDIYGDDDLSRIDPTPSGKDTDEIVNLLSTMVISDTIVKHMYGGSVSQDDGDTLYSGLDVQVTSPTSSTQPVLIQYDVATGTDAILTDYWKNAFMPDSIAGNVRILVKTRENAVDIDGKRVRGALLEFGDSFFFGGTTLGTASTALALFASNDGNNLTDVGTVAAYSITATEGYQEINYNNGNGATPFGLSYDFASQSSLETYERTKYIQRRDTSETIFARNAQLFTGINLNFAYNGETGTFVEDEVIAWGTEITFSGQATSFDVGEVITFNGTGAKGRLLFQVDDGATGTLIVAIEGSTLPLSTDTLTGEDSGGDGDVDAVTNYSNSGRALLCALDDDGTTGNLYCQLITGTTPISTQTVFGAAATAELNGVPATRTINNQFIGVYTGSNYQTNFGVGIDASDAIVGDKLVNLLGVSQEPPNNQSGVVNGLEIGDVVTCYPWDGVSYNVNGKAEPEYDEMALATALVAATSTQVDVGSGNIPKNTPQLGYVRVERDSDNNLDLIEYDSHDGDRYFEIVGTAPSAAAISNSAMRAFIDNEVSSGTQLSYTAVKDGGTNNKVTIVVKNGGVLNGPIKPYPTTATFLAGGFSVTASRISDA